MLRYYQLIYEDGISKDGISEQAEELLRGANQAISKIFRRIEEKEQSEKDDKQLRTRTPKRVFTKWSGGPEDYPIFKTQCEEIRAMNLSVVEQLSFVKSFIGDPTREKMIDNFLHSPDPIPQILKTYENHY